MIAVPKDLQKQLVLQNDSSKYLKVIPVFGLNSLHAGESEQYKQSTFTFISRDDTC